MPTPTWTRLSPHPPRACTGRGDGRVRHPRLLHGQPERHRPRGRGRQGLALPVLLGQARSLHLRRRTDLAPDLRAHAAVARRLPRDHGLLRPSRRLAGGLARLLRRAAARARGDRGHQHGDGPRRTGRGPSPRDRHIPGRSPPPPGTGRRRRRACARTPTWTRCCRSCSCSFPTSRCSRTSPDSPAPFRSPRSTPRCGARTSNVSSPRCWPTSE